MIIAVSTAPGVVLVTVFRFSINVCWMKSWKNKTRIICRIAIDLGSLDSVILMGNWPFIGGLFCILVKKFRHLQLSQPTEKNTQAWDHAQSFPPTSGVANVFGLYGNSDWFISESAVFKASSQELTLSGGIRRISRCLYFQTKFYKSIPCSASPFLFLSKWW